MKCAAVRYRRRWSAWPNHPGHGSVMPLNSHEGYEFAQTLRPLPHLPLALLSPISFFISRADVVEGNLSARPISRFRVAKSVGTAKCRQHGYIGSFHAVAHEPAQSLINQTPQR